jgi:Transcriptional regulators
MPREVNYQNEAYDRIKQLIVTSELIPGQRISKNELVKQLGIGETPIREAIILLRKDGLFQIVPQSGTYVSKINLQEMFQARFVRENIETMIFETVCDVITEEQLQELERQLKIQRIYFEEGNREMYFKLDEEFHHFFYEIADKSYVWQWLQAMNMSFNRCRYLRLDIKELQWQTILEQHEEMVKLVRHRDKEQLGQLIKEHIGMIDSDVKIIRAKFPDYFE